MQTLLVKGKLIDFSTPLVMGILNITPDSFYDGGKNNSIEEALIKAEQVIADGADIIDIGGYSTRPGAADISEQEELNRVIPVIENIIQKFPDAIISIDTFRSIVAEKAIRSGAAIINDISAGNLDDKMFDTVADLQVPYILMHMKGTPQTMQQNPNYENVVKEVFRFFTEKLTVLKQKGISDIIIDPGFGFGKTVEHNFELLRSLSFFENLGHPILTGVSRKSLITKTLNINTANALNGTTALNTIALLNGANILRVHDVKEAKEVVKLISTLNTGNLYLSELHK